MFMYIITVQCFLLKNQTVVELTNTNANRNLPWYLCCVQQTDKQTYLTTFALIKETIFCLATCTLRRVARFFTAMRPCGPARAGAEVLYCGNSIVEFLPFQKCYYYPCSERLSVVHFNFRSLSNLFFLRHRQKSTFGINKPLLGRIKSTKNVRCATGCHLLGMI